MQESNPLLQSVLIALRSGNQREAVDGIEKIVDFCILHENGKVFDGWDRDVVRTMVAYHKAKGTMVVTYDEENSITGVFMWYNCDYNDDWNFVLQWEPDREDYNSIFLAFLFAESTQAFKQLTYLFLQQSKALSTDHLLGIRHRNGVPTRVEYDQKLFKKILELN
tara:strand:+ start:632 stop:1126 length:495 start_codon:yes stop_codon:yes gene_type:complete